MLQFHILYLYLQRTYNYIHSRVVMMSWDGYFTVDFQNTMKILPPWRSTFPHILSVLYLRIFQTDKYYY